MIFFLFREFRNAFFEILHYNNCKCARFTSKRHVRTSISKSSHSMNTRVTPPNQSRQASMITSTTHAPPPRNGCLPNCSSPQTKFKPLMKTDSTDTFEMQVFASQRPTLEAFEELEHLVPNGTSGRASIVHMSSLVAEQDLSNTNNNEIRKTKRWKFRSPHRHS